MMPAVATARATRGGQAWHRALRGLSVTVTLAVVISACGGSTTQSHSTTSSHTSSHTTTSATTAAVKVAPPTLSETILTAADHTPRPSTTAVTGDALTFRTLLPGTPKREVRVIVTLSLGPGRKLTVTAGAQRHTSTATVTSAKGKPITLQQVHYTCEFPPLRSMCPLHGTTVAPQRDTVTLKAPGGTTVIFGAKVGPVTMPTVSPATSGAVVPAYKLLEKLRFSPPKVGNTAPTPSAPATAVTVKPGDSVAMTTLVGGLGGAAQKLTLDIAQGPAKTLTITAGVPGGPKVPATITSATGKPIELVLPHYVCFLAPAPTFCPATGTVARAHHFIVTFPVRPKAQPVTIAATVQAG